MKCTSTRVLDASNNNIVFICRFVDHSKVDSEPISIVYNFEMLDKDSVRKVAEILHTNEGKSLLSIGEIELPGD